MSEPKVIGALRRAAARIEYERERWTGATMREMGFARTVDSGTPADAALLDSLAEALAAAAPSLRYAACTDSLPAADRASVRRLASLLTTEED